MIQGGFHQKLLRIDLTTRTSRTEVLEEDLLRKYFGGRTLGGKLLWDEVPPGTDPLGPDNKLIFTTGAFNGVPVPAASRYCLVTLSPETGLYCDSYSGGHFGPEIKFAGYDVLVIQGCADQPTTVLIEDDSVRFLDAAHLWGLSAWDAEETLERELGPDTHVCTIGVAGERLSNLAVVQNEYYHEAGRGGVGAVFGSKRLKALAVHGTGSVRVAEPQQLLSYIRNTLEPKFTADGGKHGGVADRMKFGTQMTLNVTNAVGVLPTRNYQVGQFEQASEINGDAFRREVVEKDRGCFSCNFSCVKFSRAKKGPYAGAKTGGPEYEANALLGANLDIGDPHFIVRANALCNELGIDTIGAGVLVGFAMELYETGILTKEDLGGLDLHFGNQEAALEMIRMIGQREGIGDLFSCGVKRAAEVIGHGSERIAMQVKGMEFPAYRAGINSPAFGLVYCITERGACHRRAWPSIAEQFLKPFTTEGRAGLVKHLYDERIPWHAGVCCDIGVTAPNFTFEDCAMLYSLVTGWSVSSEEMDQLCERTATLLRALNFRYGMTHEQETLPERCFEPEIMEKGKGLTYTREMLEQSMQEYFALRHWDRNGIPSPDYMRSLGLMQEAEEFSHWEENR